MNDTIPTPRMDAAAGHARGIVDQAIFDEGCALERELAEIRALTEWRDISTAPKDGNEILVVMGGRTTIALWNDQRYHQNPKPYWKSIGNSGATIDRSNQPLLWIPLPPPPKI